jgi:hypothetical protein
MILIVALSIWDYKRSRVYVRGEQSVVMVVLTRSRHRSKVNIEAMIIQLPAK